MTDELTETSREDPLTPEQRRRRYEEKVAKRREENRVTVAGLLAATQITGADRACVVNV